MEIKNLVTKYIYRIEPKPGGGFIARATDPNVAPLEAATRAELQQKIQDTILAGLASDFPGLKLPLQTGEMKFAFHVEHNPDGGFTIHSSDPATAQMLATSHDEVESKFAEKLIGFMGKHLVPELSAALAVQGASGDVKVFVKKTGFTLTTDERHSLGSNATLLSVGTSTPATDVNSAPVTIDGVKVNNPSPGGAQYPVSNSPITPVSEGNGNFFRWLLAALIIVGLIYLFLHHHF